MIEQQSRIQYRPVPESERDAGRRAPGSDADRRLVAAISTYLHGSRNRAAAKGAIGSWCRDIGQVGLAPEKLLVRFKIAIDSVASCQDAAGHKRWLADRRDMIAWCIDEYYAGQPGAP